MKTISFAASGSAGPGARWVFFRPDGTVVPQAPPPLPATDASGVTGPSLSTGTAKF